MSKSFETFEERFKSQNFYENVFNYYILPNKQINIYIQRTIQSTIICEKIVNFMNDYINIYNKIHIKTRSGRTIQTLYKSKLIDDNIYIYTRILLDDQINKLSEMRYNIIYATFTEKNKMYSNYPYNITEEDKEIMKQYYYD